MLVYELDQSNVSLTGTVGSDTAILKVFFNIAFKGLLYLSTKSTHTIFIYHQQVKKCIYRTLYK